MLFLVQALVSGLSQGAIYAVVASGLALILGNLKVVNLAHGSFFTLGAYLAFTLYRAWGWSPLFAWLPVGGVVFFVATLVYQVVVGPLREHRTTVAVATLGLGMLMESLFIIIWSPLHNYLPTTLPVIRVGGVRINLQEAYVGLVALLIMGLLFAFLRTRSGRALRFAAHDAEVAATVGIDVARLHMFTFGAAGALAAVAGSLMAPLLTIHSTMGRMPMIIGLAVVIVGGMGNIHGALVAGLALGTISSLVGFYLSPALVYVLSLAIIVIALALRPAGLYGALMRLDR